ncbi:MAG: acyl-CoA dehydrogenase family protein, partial [Nocardioidaceae bacterium]|nr:acyl-CoA dehydrogenase family protein [Nocardioidaceae bacterium]
MSLISNLKPGGKHGVPSSEGRDPIGYLVAGLNRLAQTDLLDKVRLRKPAEQVVFSVTRSGFKTITNASRTFAKAGKKSQPGTRPQAAAASGVFDLTPGEDEQMLVDVVGEFSEEVVRPAAVDADKACAAPVDLLKASLDIGLPILGLPESLGGVSEERSAVAGTLVAEALAHGDMGLAVAALAPGSVATAIGLWGTDAQQQTYLPAFSAEGGTVPAAALALNEPSVLFDVLAPAATATKTAEGYLLNGTKSLVARGDSAEL